MNEITIKPLEQISDDRLLAQQLHFRIIANGSLAASAIVDMCKDLKKMRDEKLYTQLGYATFEEYAEQAVGIKQRQAYSYILVYEKLGSTVLQSNATLGITKLELLTHIPPTERTEFMDDNNVDDLSARELKAKIAELNKAQVQISMLRDINQELKAQAENRPEADEDKYKQEIAQLKWQLEKKETQPANKMAIEKEVKKAVREAEKKKTAEIAALKKEKEESIKAEREKVLEEANERIEKIVSDKQKTDAALRDALKASKINRADPLFIEINFVFRDIQSTANNLMDLIQKYEQKNKDQAVKLKGVMVGVFAGLVKNMEGTQ